MIMACDHYRPDHNGECLNCDEPADAHADVIDAKVVAHATDDTQWDAPTYVPPIDWTVDELLALYRTWTPGDLTELREALRLDARDGDEKTRRFCERRLRAIAVVEHEREG